MCKNSEEWTEKLCQLIEDNELRNRMAQNAHERVTKEYLTDDIEPEIVRSLVDDVK